MKRVTAADETDLVLIEQEFNEERKLIQTDEASIFMAQKKLNEQKTHLQKRKESNHKLGLSLAARRYGIVVPSEPKLTLTQASERLRGPELTEALLDAIDEAGPDGILDGELGHVFFGQTKETRQKHLRRLIEREDIREEATLRGHKYFDIR
jgi:hypothetical protein